MDEARFLAWEAVRVMVSCIASSRRRARPTANCAASCVRWSSVSDAPGPTPLTSAVSSGPAPKSEPAAPEPAPKAPKPPTRSSVPSLHGPYASFNLTRASASSRSSPATFPRSALSSSDTLSSASSRDVSASCSLNANSLALASWCFTSSSSFFAFVSSVRAFSICIPAAVIGSSIDGKGAGGLAAPSPASPSPRSTSSSAGRAVVVAARLALRARAASTAACVASFGIAGGPREGARVRGGSASASPASPLSTAA
mmetsp:Transcript_6744/g.22394  ORF Transcript_6744/g.22394 Transcript_6744/m.22394 type:complete len:256 (+) Transcript_6744:58-825(+)